MAALTEKTDQQEELSPNRVPQADFTLHYEQKDITHDVTESLLSLTYTDHLTGQADDLQVELMDVEGTWRDIWYPGHGDSLALIIGWKGHATRQVGRFEIDQIEAASAPSTVSIGGIGAGINLPIRTTEHRAYENTTLDGIARQVAQRLGLELTGKIIPLKLDRVTQQESDLAFLNKLAAEYDYAFKVVGKRLVFHSIDDLARQKPVASFTLKDLASFRFHDQIRHVPKATQTKSRDSGSKKLITYRIINDKTVAVPSSSRGKTTSADSRKKTKRSRSEQQAKARANADLARSNRERTTGTWTLIGRPNLISGSVVLLNDAGKLGGLYLITSARHSISRHSGYEIELEVCRVAAPSIGQALPEGTVMNTYGIALEEEEPVA